MPSLLELELDFGEEDVEFADRTGLARLLAEVRGVVAGLLRSFELGNVIKNGITTVIAGRPNAGKSTLLNALLREERAIVSAIPGTTRDFIEDEVSIDGLRFRFVDTAGLRDNPADEVEAIGVQRTRQRVRPGRPAAVPVRPDGNEPGRGAGRNRGADYRARLAGAGRGQQSRPGHCRSAGCV